MKPSPIIITAPGIIQEDFQAGLEAQPTTTKMKTQPRPATAREKAETIADQLFTNGQWQMAHRLVLELDGGYDGGGWCKQAVVDLIERALRN